MSADPVVRQRFPGRPVGGDIGVAALLAEVRGAGPLWPGDPRMVAFLSAFARRLLAPGAVRRFPELASLGFFLRRSELEHALASLRPPPGAVRRRRGLVFHVPPANVDTIFVYSWALSALAGNTNIIRLSPRAGAAAEAALEALEAAAAEADPIVAATQRIVTYGHDEAATALLSAACDLRVVWGGDASVAAIRRHPLSPGARDLPFPDRTSFAAVSATGWEAAPPHARAEAARGLFNDAYWFDQAACASPRALYWVGDPAGAAAASEELFGLLRSVLDERGWVTTPEMAVRKQVAAYGAAAEGLVTGIRFAGNEVAVLDLASPRPRPEGWLGAGVFPQATVGSLEALASLVEPRDQTVTTFGFRPEELAAFVAAIPGAGVDRVVPFGSALSFSALWDGYDLLAEFTRLTAIP